MPTLASLLPSYTNSEADFIVGAFSTGAMQTIQELPTTLKAEAVIARKQQIQEAAQQLLQRACSPFSVQHVYGLPCTDLESSSDAEQQTDRTALGVQGRRSTCTAMRPERSQSSSTCRRHTTRAPSSRVWNGVRSALAGCSCASSLPPPTWRMFLITSLRCKKPLHAFLFKSLRCKKPLHVSVQIPALPG